MNVPTTVVEAFQHGVRIADERDVYDQIVAVGDGRPQKHWRLTDSEWAQLLDAMRAHFAFLGAPPVKPDMTDGEVRFCASRWHGGQASPLYALCSTGSVLPGVAGEIEVCLGQCEDIEPYIHQSEHDGEAESLQAADRRQLRGLLAYVDYHGLRGPQICWTDRD